MLEDGTRGVVCCSVQTEEGSEGKDRQNYTNSREREALKWHPRHPAGTVVAARD